MCRSNQANRSFQHETVITLRPRCQLIFPQPNFALKNAVLYSFQLKNRILYKVYRSEFHRLPADKKVHLYNSFFSYFPCVSYVKCDNNGRNSKRNSKTSQRNKNECCTQFFQKKNLPENHFCETHAQNSHTGMN